MLKQNDNSPVTGIEAQLGLDQKTEPITAGPDAPLEERLKYGTPLHAKILTSLMARLKLGKDAVQQRYDAWDQVDEQTRLYANLNRGAKRGDGTSMSDTLEMPFERGIVVPASYAILMVRLSQLMSILTNRMPLWEIDGRGDDDVESSKLMEAAIDYDMQQCYALLALYSQMQDSEKYGIGVIYDVWESENGWKYTKPNVAPGTAQTIGQMFGMPMTPRKEWGTVKEYNNWTPIDPYRFWCDPRVPKSRFQTGEFAGHRVNRSYLYLMERQQPYGPYFNMDSLPAKQAEIKDITPKRDTLLGTTYDLKASTDPDDKGYYIVDALQIRLIPREWGLGPETLPEIWWFTVVNELVIVRAHKSSYDHGQFTYGVIESNYDHHALYNPGNIENIDGLQRFMSWLLNSHLENIRKALNDVLIYSPALIEESDLLNPGPVRHVRISPKGEELLLAGLLQPSQLVQQLQITDVTKPHLEAFKFIYEMCQLMMATNDPMTGAPTQNKKTLGEVNQMMFGAGKRISLSFRLNELMGWQPQVLRAISNRQQFTSTEQYMRILGGAGSQTPGAIQRLLVKPWDLQGNFDYICRSAMLPPDPGRQAMVWVQLMLGLSKFPQIMAPGPDGKMLDMRRIFNEIARCMGIRNIGEFYTMAPMPGMMPGMPGMPPGTPPGQMPVQVMPDHEVANGVQRGDLTPVPGRLPGIPGMTP